MKTKRVGKHRECVETGKICFNSREDAERRISQICRKTDQSGKRWRQYKCAYCGRIHLSSGVKGKGLSTETAWRKQRLNASMT